MKKIISVLLASVLLFAMFALCVSADSATNLALNATVNATATNQGSNGFQGSLNDGAYGTYVDDYAGNTGWFTFTACWSLEQYLDPINTVKVDDNYSLGTVTLNLDDTYNLSEVRIHVGGGNRWAGDVFTTPTFIKVYTSSDNGATWGSAVNADLSDVAAGGSLVPVAVSGSANAVKLEFGVVNETRALISEIEVYAGSAPSIPDEDSSSTPESSTPESSTPESSTPSTDVLVEGLISNGASVTVTNSAGETIQGARTYKGNLTDGTFDVAEGAAEWFGFFRNGETPDQNVADGIGYITIDLGKEYDLTKVRVFVPADTNTAPGSVTAAISADGTTYGAAAALAATSSTTDNGTWMSVATEGTGRYVKLEVKVGDGQWQYWALLSEVQVYGMTNAPQGTTPSTGDASTMLGFAILAVIAITGSAVVIKTRR